MEDRMCLCRIDLVRPDLCRSGMELIESRQRVNNNWGSGENHLKSMKHHVFGLCIPHEKSGDFLAKIPESQTARRVWLIFKLEGW